MSERYSSILVSIYIYFCFSELISQCSDEAFEDFDDDLESVNSDTVSVCSEGKQSSLKDKEIKSHRRYKSCDVKALIASANRTTSVDEGYSASTKSDTSSDSHSPEISPLPDQADNPPSADTTTDHHTHVDVCSKEVAAKESDNRNLVGHNAEDKKNTGVLVAKGSTADVKAQASCLTQDVSELGETKTKQATVTESLYKVAMKDASQGVSSGLSHHAPNVTRKPVKLQTKAALPLLDIATLSKDRTYSF